MDGQLLLGCITAALQRFSGSSVKVALRLVPRGSPVAKAARGGVWRSSSETIWGRLCTTRPSTTSVLALIPESPESRCAREHQMDLA